MEAVVPRTWVGGTPRGYANNEVASEWLNELPHALAQSAEAGKTHGETARYEVVLEFRVFPRSPRYWGQNLPHGTDLDNLIKQTLDGLAVTRSSSLPPGLGILSSDSAVYRLVATKEHVSSDDETGAWVTVSLM
jgi:hypothetical protein